MTTATERAVLDGLRRCTSPSTAEVCQQCPYFNGDGNRYPSWCSCNERLMFDALHVIVELRDQRDELQRMATGRCGR